MTTFERVTPRLLATDLPRTRAFYEEDLGFRTLVAWPDGDPTFVILERGSVTVGFFEADSGRQEEIGYVELYVDVSDVRALHHRLQERGVAIEWGPEVYSYGCREFAVRDPDRYLLIFTEPTDEPPTTAEPGDAD